MKRVNFLMMLPLVAVSTLLAACATTANCNNDACYDRSVSSVDPYKKGDIAAWGTEKQVAAQEEEAEMRERRSTPVMRRHER